MLRRLSVLLALTAPWTSASLAAPDDQAPSGAPAAPPRQPQDAQAFPVGQWPEGLMVSGGSVWVTESGVRSVARLDAATGKRQKTIKIGRLPVSIAAAPDGAAIVQVSTNKVIKRIDAKTGKVAEVVKTPDGPEETVVDGPYAYTLLWQADSSAGSSVLRTHLATRKTTRSANTGADAFGLAVGGRSVWIARGGGEVSVIDATTLAPRGVVRLGGRPYYAAYGAGAAIIAGSKAVARIDPETLQVTARAELGAHVRAVAAFDDVVIVGTVDGDLWLLEPKSLAVRVILTPSTVFEPHGIARDGQTVWVTTHSGLAGGDGGAVVRVALP